MGTVKEAAVRTLGRARTAGVQAKRKGAELAQKLAKEPVVRKAQKKAANVRGKAAALAGKVADRVSGRARKRKRTKVAVAAAAGAIAVAAAVGIGVARKRKR